MREHHGAGVAGTGGRKEKQGQVIRGSVNRPLLVLFLARSAILVQRYEAAAAGECRCGAALGIQHPQCLPRDVEAGEQGAVTRLDEGVLRPRRCGDVCERRAPPIGADLDQAGAGTLNSQASGDRCDTGRQGVQDEVAGPDTPRLKARGELTHGPCELSVGEPTARHADRGSFRGDAGLSKHTRVQEEVAHRVAASQADGVKTRTAAGAKGRGAAAPTKC